MILDRGVRLGPYEILALIGAGGMGEVYRARDPRLGRDVAIKVSKERFTERFAREARTIASLNHPNICTLYDVGPNYLVMELVDGPTLTDRIRQGSVPIEEAVKIAIQMAAALEAAHEKGIVHRDLKPGNVKIKLDGTVKVLDFGLAKAGGTPTVTDAGGGPDNSPTISMGDTKAGAILGTVAYMAPEQAKGKPVDKRADIWAFGVVLYETLTGRRLFRGETTTEILASVIKEEPEWDRIPRQAERLLRLCLRKNPTERLHDIADAKLLLEEASTPPAPRRIARWLWLGAASLFLFALAFLTFVHFRQAPPAAEPVRFTIPLPENVTFNFANAFAVSPDGRKVVFDAIGPGGAQLWLRTLDSNEAHPLSEAGIVNAATLFWSPDNRSIAYMSQGKLKQIDIAGGPAQTICDIPRGAFGGSWNRDGVIIFGTDGGLMRVAAAGGSASALTSAESSRGEAGHIHPFFLPDGKHFLYLISHGENSGVYVGSVDAKPEAQNRKRLIATRFSAAYAPSSDPARGQLLFLREGTLMAQAFDARRLELAGDAVPMVEGVGSPVP
ncbi:MAG TPA: protein kinase, partial [Candidatus Sulfopaludibacter sp.]|nr:protein kinase [Candidatus Sulfopaludibacter sp.]